MIEYRGAGTRGAALIPSQLAPVRADASVRATQGGPAATAARLQSEVQTVLYRPLFSPSRRPGHATVASTALPRLAGIIIGPYGARAIFATEGEDRAIVAGPGAHAGPYLIRAVGATGVSVVGPNGPELLHPSYDRNATHDLPAAGLQGVQGAPSILDLLRSHVQGNGGFRPALLPSPLLQTVPGQQR